MFEKINSCVWGAGLTTLLLGVGAMFFIKLRLYSPKRFSKIFLFSLSGIFGKDGKEKLKTLSTALGATMGTGNIIGVCSAIAIGGAGAVFWMWVSAFLGMATAFAENYLASKYSKNGVFGASAYLKFGVKSEFLSKMFAFCVMLSSLGMGSTAQSNTLSQAVFDGFSIPKIISGTIASILVFCVISGGAKRLKNACVLIVPPLSLFYMAISFAVVFVYRENIPKVMFDIFSQAFDLKAIIGGFASSALSVGLRRGAFSNEAGLGSSSLFHSADETLSAESLGALAAFEVFVDTIICCTLTALCVLCAGRGFDVSAAFSGVFGSFSSCIVAVSLTLFALATILGWSLCAEKSAVFIFGEKSIPTARLVFSLSVFVGAVFRSDSVWILSDIFNGLMAYPNIFGLIYLAKEVKFD